MSTTALAIITGALQDLQVIDPEDTPSSAMTTVCFRRLNLMMATLSLQPLTMPVTSREVFDLVADQGGPDNPYTIGPGGDFNTTRPAANSLTGAGLLLTNTTPIVEIPRAIITDDAWQAIQVKSLGNPLLTDVYYNATFDDGLGRIYLWPVPNGDQVTQLALYRNEALVQFTTLTASYDLPEGAEEAIQNQLAVRLIQTYAVPADVAAPIRDTARISLNAYKRSNVRMTDLPQDPATTHDMRGGYNIQTGTGG